MAPPSHQKLTAHLCSYYVIGLAHGDTWLNLLRQNPTDERIAQCRQEAIDNRAQYCQELKCSERYVEEMNSLFSILDFSNGKDGVWVVSVQRHGCWRTHHYVKEKNKALTLMLRAEYMLNMRDKDDSIMKQDLVEYEEVMNEYKELYQHIPTVIDADFLLKWHLVRLRFNWLMGSQGGHFGGVVCHPLL